MKQAAARVFHGADQTLATPPCLAGSRGEVARTAKRRLQVADFLFGIVDLQCKKHAETDDRNGSDNRDGRQQAAE